MEADNIAILMATYNGCKYIVEQLQSLINQTYTNITIYIRDDGSTDNTLDIIQTFTLNYPDKIILIKDETFHRGPKDGFMWLLSKVEADYYMFCDQDDVWLPFKIEHTLKRMKEVERNNPEKAVMIHTDLVIVDKDLKQIFPSFWVWRHFNVDLNKHFKFCPIGNVFTGCTMMINNFCKPIVFPMSSYASMHDEWIGLKVSQFGIVENLKEQTILYRQHDSNVCSIGTQKQLKINIVSFFNLIGWYYKKKDLLVELNYGSPIKAFFYKLQYNIIRFFNRN